MEETNDLRKLLDESWLELEKKYPGKKLIRLQDNVIFNLNYGPNNSILTITGGIENVIGGLTSLYEVLYLSGPYFPTECTCLGCQIVFQKENGEIIPIYVAENLEDGEKEIQKKFYSSAQSLHKSWKFGIVSNLYEWWIYGLDTRKGGITPMKVEIKIADPTRDQVMPLIRNLLPVLTFGLKNIHDQNHYTIVHGMKKKERNK